MYRIILLSDAEKSFRRLDPPTQKKITQKIDLEVLPEEAKKELIDFIEVIKFL